MCHLLLGKVARFNPQGRYNRYSRNYICLKYINWITSQEIFNKINHAWLFDLWPPHSVTISLFLPWMSTCIQKLKWGINPFKRYKWSKIPAIWLAESILVVYLDAKNQNEASNPSRDINNQKSQNHNRAVFEERYHILHFFHYKYLL